MVDLCRKQTATSSASLGEVVAGNTGPTAGQGKLPDGAANQYKAFNGHPYTAISLIAKKVAGQQILVAHKPTSRPIASGLSTKSTLGDSLDPLDTHPLLDAIASPNPLMVRWSLIYSTVASLLITGRAYWWFAEGGNPYDIWPIPSHWVTPANTMRTAWKISLDGGVNSIDVPGEFIAPFILPDPGNMFGSISPMQTQAVAIDADNKLQRSQSKLMGCIKPGVIITAGEMDPLPGTITGPRIELTSDQRKQIISAIRGAYDGVHHHGDPIILDRLIKDVKPFTDKPKDLDWLTGGKQLRSRIFSAYGVNPILVGEVENANRAQAVVANKIFCENVIGPLLTFMSETLTRWAAPLYATENEHLAVWFEECKADDVEMELKWWTMLSNSNQVTPNEIRQFRNLPPIPGGDELPSQAVPAVAAAVKGLLPDLNPFTLKRFSSNGHTSRPMG